MKRVKFGVIGLKGVGRSHLRSIKALDLAELSAVADINERIGKEVSSEYNVEWFKDYVEMLEKADIDAVCICTPHFLHYPMACMSLQFEKHVLVEKPMSITVSEADEMINVALRKNLKIGVVFQNRLNPVAIKVKEIIERNLKKIYRVSMEACFFRSQAYYNSDPWRGKWATEGGGVLINQGIHHLDLLQWLVGKPVKLQGQIGTLIHKIEVEDVASATILFEGGSHGVIQLSTIDAPSTVRLEVMGDGGKVIFEGNKITYWALEAPVKNCIQEAEAWGRPKVECREIVVEEKGPGHAGIIEDFAKAILEDRDPLVPGKEGRVSVEIANAIIFSSFTEKTINFPIDRKAYDDLLRKLREKGD
ncbi:TPA: Gfo/Idh/MocA family oxidoreductase [Candidatus Bathyarchaeota archaeon]|nr:Gfo/Idh/MocA family oxidoreductase [Candidatus Bathyarchaeota archaeon]